MFAVDDVCSMESLVGVVRALVVLVVIVAISAADVFCSLCTPPPVEDNAGVGSCPYSSGTRLELSISRRSSDVGGTFTSFL